MTGRILVLEQDNARVQAFDTMGNPVYCFAGDLTFALPSSVTSDDLDAGTVDLGLREALAQNVPPTLVPLLELDAASAADLDRQDATSAIIQQFSNAGV